MGGRTMTSRALRRTAMTEHLPECHLFLEPMLSAQDWCICDELRACEQRVLRAAIDAMDAVDAQYEANPDWVLWEARTAIEALKEKS